MGGKRYCKERAAASAKKFGWEGVRQNCKEQVAGDDRRVFSTLGEKRYCGDKDAVSCKDHRGVGGSGTEYESWGLYVLVGGDGMRYCGERVGATLKFFGVGKEGAGNSV